MILNFIKYQGAGNDFILIDNRQRLYDQLDVARLCHPKFGIGADGLMLLQNTNGYDFEMVYYNSDGNTSTMCGNGGRCIVDFAKRLNIIESSTVFKAIDGRHDAIWSQEKVELKMVDVHALASVGESYDLNTGSPHFVVFVNNVNEIDLLNEARKIRYDTPYEKEGINVNFVEIINDTSIKVRTYERGVENETLSCGTGVTASSIALSKKLNSTNGTYNIAIQTPGGNLEVKYSLKDKHYNEVWLIGPATMVFEGSIVLN